MSSGYIDECERIIWNLENDPMSFSSGRRNDDCVNSMIACYALGLDWEVWFNEHWRLTYQVNEHYNRIKPYIEVWFEDGPEKALSYMV